MAIDPEPGIPKIRVGTRPPPSLALLEDSGPIMPRISPDPNPFLFDVVCTVCPLLVFVDQEKTMQSRARSIAIPGALALPLLLVAAPAQALEQGDMLVRAGLAQVAPNDEATPLSGATTSSVEVGSATNVGVNFTYMITDNWGVEVLGALRFAHDIRATGALADQGRVIETEQLPPTVMAVYNFSPASNLRPYVGAGLNYTTFMNETGKAVLDGQAIRIDDSTGLALEVGVDYDLDQQLFLNASLWYIDIETTVDTGLVGTTEVSIDPWVLFLGAGWRF